MTLRLRPMRSSDIAAVVEIDRLSFDAPWSAQSYQFEINESNYSYMLVFETVAETPQANNSLTRFMRSLGVMPAPQAAILSYGGLWNIADEAHISTIATHPLYRGKGYGEVALAAMVRRSFGLKAAYVILEVRVTNTIAQNLYIKYGFVITTRKENYYQSNGEDAYEMRLDLTPENHKHVETLFNALVRKFRFIDEYTEYPANHHTP